MPTLYAMCGLPFAGKSTAARALQLRTKAVLVQLDAINAKRGLGLDGSAIPHDEWTRTYAEASAASDTIWRMARPSFSTTETSVKGNAKRSATSLDALGPRCDSSTCS